ncbi:hypothetical protein Bpfe_016702, partial [Biomphalaria pfeifferi]
LAGQSELWDSFHADQPDIITQQLWSWELSSPGKRKQEGLEIHFSHCYELPPPPPPLFIFEFTVYV